MTLRRLLREPLVHFLGLGLALFIGYAVVAPETADDDRIVISAAASQSLALQYEKLWGRAPTSAELEALIDARVTDEILTREGLALGLDKDDDVIKRRIRQKYELIAEEEANSEPPTGADLQAYLEANPDRFRNPPILSFRQVMVPLTGSEAEVDARIAQTRKALEKGAVPQSASSLLPSSMVDVPIDLVARDFGSRFAEAVAAAPVGIWSGPTPSAYGVHFVNVDARSAATLPALEAIRPLVQREWENARRTRTREARLAELRQRYVVVVEGLPAK